jgi:hypothetical protein
MNISPVSGEELLDYVIERDFEDTVSRVILGCIRDIEPIGKATLVKLLRGVEPYNFREKKYEEVVRNYWGRLSLLDKDQTLDFIESLCRMGLIESSSILFGWCQAMQLTITAKGTDALKHSQEIKAQIPWPLPAKDFPEYRPFGPRRVVNAEQ